MAALPLGVNSLAAIVLGLVVFTMGALYASKFRCEPLLDRLKHREFRLIQKTKLNSNTSIYRFALPRKTDVLPLPIGQHISVVANINGKEMARSYTPISNNTTAGYFDILVKTYPTGNVSKHIDAMEIGDSLRVRGPFGNMKYTPNMCKHINMIAGGTGITPMFQVIEAICSNPQDKTTVTLLYGNVSEVDILLRTELEALAALNPRLKIYHVLNLAPKDGKYDTGFITRDIMERYLDPPSKDSKLLLCGPPPMLSALKKAAMELGWPKARPLSKLEDQVFVF